MKQILLAFALIVSFQSRGQITFIDTNTPWKELSKRAVAEDKLIFIHFENSECVQCNEVASQGFAHEELKELYGDSFIAIRCNVASPNGRSLAQRFGIMTSLISIYVDPKGNILHVNNGSTSNYFTYEQGAEVALSRKGRKQLADYEQEYKAGAREPAFMREYLTKRREASMAIGELLDAYVTALPADSLRDLQHIKQIYEFAPALQSKAYRRMKEEAPKSLTDSLFRISTAENRKLIHDGILENSFQQAIRARDEDYAVEIAEYARDADTTDRRKSEMAYDKAMIRYYYGTRNLRKYFAYTENFLDTRYMPLTIDSLNAIDDAAFMSHRKELNAKRAKKEMGVSVMAFSFMPPSQHIPRELNEHAFHFYELTRDKALLEKALTWSKKSIELAEHKAQKARTPYKLGDPNLLDTYAHILYKLGRQDEAIEWQTKAVEAQKVTGQSYQSFVLTLDKMKQGTL